MMMQGKVLVFKRSSFCKWFQKPPGFGDLRRRSEKLYTVYSRFWKWLDFVILKEEREAPKLG